MHACQVIIASKDTKVQSPFCQQLLIILSCKIGREDSFEDIIETRVF